MTKCFVWFCKNKKGISSKDIHFFRMSKDRSHSWMRSLGRDPNEGISSYNLICSQHFKAEDIVEVGGKTTLKKDAVPSLCLKFSDAARKSAEAATKTNKLRKNLDPLAVSTPSSVVSKDSTSGTSTESPTLYRKRRRSSTTDSDELKGSPKRIRNEVHNYCSASSSIQGDSGSLVNTFGSNNILKMELREGLKFPSYEELANFIMLYECKTKQKYWKRSSRTIENARLRRPCNENLKYYEIRYSCMYGGRKFITRGKGLEKVSSQRMDCPAYIKIRASEDGQFLEIKHYSDKHENHAQSMLEDDVEDYDNLPTVHKIKRRKRRTSSQTIHFGFDGLSSSLTTKQEDGDAIDIDEHTIEEYVEPKIQSTTGSHDCSNIENQVTSQTGLKLTNDDFFMPTNQIQQVDNLEARAADNIFMLNNEQTSRIAPKEINQEANQYSHTTSLCILCAEDVSNNHLKKLVKELSLLILDVTSIDVTQYPFESNCCETCYQFLMQIKDFQKRVRAASLLINQRLQETSKEIEFVSFTEENLPTTSSVEECNVFQSTDYAENEDNQYAQSLIQTDENTIIKSEDTQNSFTTVNEDICHAINSVNEVDQQISDDTNQLSIKTEFEEMDHTSIQIDELNEDDSNLEPIKAEYLTSSMNQYLSGSNPFSALGMNAEDEENEIQCGSYEEFLKEANGNECKEDNVKESLGVLPDVVDAINNITLKLIPEKSRQKYELAYSKFKQWCENKKVREVTENVLLRYFLELSEQLKSSSLWSRYSMLNASLEVKDDINIKKFSKLTSFLKWKSRGYCAKKSKTFSRDEIKRFLLQAPDDKYLMMKVVLIVGVAGARRRNDLCKITVDEFEDTGNTIIINTPKTESSKEHSYIIQGEHEDLNMANIFRKYAGLRPAATEHRRFFVCYKQGQCTARPVGMNTFGKIPSDIARYLGLNNPNSYTGNCFQKSSVMLLTNVDKVSLERDEDWKLKEPAESYIKELLDNKKKIANQHLSGDDYKQNTPTVTETIIRGKKNVLPLILPSSSIFSGINLHQRYKNKMSHQFHCEVG